MKATATEARVKHNIRETVLYLVFGVLTTVISVILYWLLTRLMLFGYYSSNILSWVGAVTFAYITNKIIVFSDRGHFWKKAIAFFASRLFSLVVEMVVMYVMIEWLTINDLLTKIVVQIIVIVLNYMVSKFVVFRKEKRKKICRL